MTKDQKALHITLKKETVADDNANNNTRITSPVSQSTLSDFSKNLEEPSPTKKEEAIDDQTGSIDSHEIQCEKEYEIDLRADTGTLFFPDKNAISTIDHGQLIDHEHTGKGKNKHTGKGKGNHVEVVETNQPSETASTMSVIESGDVDENMNMVRTEAEAWRLIHSRYAQNTTEMISGSLLHDSADKHNQLLDEFVPSMESKEHKWTEDLAGIQAFHHEQQILLPRSLDEYQTKFRDEHNEITKTMKDLLIIQHQAELEEKADNGQQLRK